MEEFSSHYIEQMLQEKEQAPLQSEVQAGELVRLCAVDTELFCKSFFPKAFRQESPSFARPLWELLESEHRLINVQMFRGSGKTTRCRAFTTKMICYGLAHTVLYIGKSEGHAVRSIQWIKRQITYNRLLTGTFGLQKGAKWTDTECEIMHGVDEYPIWIMGMGITGSIRGINQDDFRPDLIVMDDIYDEELAATREQREKVENLVYGAIMESLAPRSEAPHAKLINLATPLDTEDVSCKALKDKAWKSIVIPCWTMETRHLPNHLRESSWPERWSSQELRREKELALARNKLSAFSREKELELIAPEECAFKPEWLSERWQVLPEGMVTFLAIDPVPPPSAKAVLTGLHKNDYEAFAVVGVYRGSYFVLDLSANRGHEPSWTCAEFFRLAVKWRPRHIFVEATAYQRTLQWLLKQEMIRRGIYFAVHDFPDQGRAKFSRIVDGLNGPASFNKLLLPHDAEERGEAWQMFIEQFMKYPNIKNDDVLEAVAVAATGAAGKYDVLDEGQDLEQEREQYPRLAYSRGAP